MPKFKDAIRIVEEDGWRLVSVRGSHRHFTHPTKRGKVTIAGHPNKHVAPGTWASIMRQAGIKR